MESLFDFRGFDWDEGNAGKNLQKHGVADGECEEIFFNAPLLLAEDIKHSAVESRFAAFGITASGRLLTVVFTRRKDLLRVISARDMNRKERIFYKQYEKNTEI